ncbi:hypothetical protein V1477_017967 [Vespula maculifrons]|uniref:Uncharacterized protein n=2 Tax=Vespula TaxID=7451 RepID=A0A834KK30_VESVU|nr:hypothetical protein HZH66_002685 [Vespula vulgaris]
MHNSGIVTGEDIANLASMKIRSDLSASPECLVRRTSSEFNTFAQRAPPYRAKLHRNQSPTYEFQIFAKLIKVIILMDDGLSVFHGFHSRNSRGQFVRTADDSRDDDPLTVDDFPRTWGFSRES